MTEQEKIKAQGEDPVLQTHRATLFAMALAEARKAVAGKVFKGGEKKEGPGGAYKYVGHEHINDHVRAALIANNLCLIQTGTHCHGMVEIGSNKGLFHWSASFLVMHSSGYAITMSFECHTQPGDKGGYQASTALERTAEFRLMAIAGTADEDPEHDSNNRETVQTTQARVQHMADKRQTRDVAAERRKAVIAEHIAHLPGLRNYDALVEWAAFLLAGNDEIESIPREYKSPAWNAYGNRCEQLNIDPSSTINDYNRIAKDLKNGKA